MELIIGLIVIAAIGYFVFFRKKDEPLVASAPYKVDVTPAPVAPVVEPPAVVTTPVVEVAPAETVVTAPEAVVEVAEAPAKKPRKPRAPKVEAVVEKKPVAKKPAAKKPVAKKPAARSVVKSKK
jgi:hypothetical protein